MDEKKKNRLEKIILQTINMLISTRQFRNPNIDSSVFAVAVRISPDVAYADVYINQYQINKMDIKKIVTELDKSKGFIQGEIARVLKTRLTPKLRFHEDISLEMSYRINDTMTNLTNVKTENKDKDSNQDDDQSNDDQNDSDDNDEDNNNKI